MKTLKKIINCLKSYIKKNFFNLPKTDISQDCEKVFGMNILTENEVEAKTIPVEEYVTCYNCTTRWQTL
ncbi:hypothetical protein [Mariniphaga sp.]|uniref:hypothetical protein n=1 Tax=Mariniphaga sp. TaxID=1954475 RepID=UPI003569EBE8